MSVVQGKKISTFLKKKILNLPSVPGCYLWLKTKLPDRQLKAPEDEEILYIGKAFSIKERVQSYLSSEDYKTSFLMSEVKDIFWIATTSESEALLLESTLIKRVQPIYNIRLKDDKRYPYLCLTLGEMFPRLLITRRKLNKKNYYYGPYANVGAARRTKQLIEKIFPIRKKNLRLPQKNPQNPCLNHHMGRCWAPCTQNVSVEEYWDMTKQIKNFLENKNNEIVQNLESQMKFHASNLEYEKAVRIRNILNDLKVTLEYQQGVCGGEKDEGSFNVDIVVVAQKQEQEVFPFLGSNTLVKTDTIFQRDENLELEVILHEVVLLKIRSGNIIQKQEFSVEPQFVRFNTVSHNIQYLESLKQEALEVFFREYYLSIHEIPTSIYVSNQIDLVSWSSILSKRSTKKVDVKLKEISIDSNTKKVTLSELANYKSYNIDLILQVAISNAKLVLEEKNTAFKMNQRETGLKQVQEIFSLKELPIWIECFDISNIQGTHAVGEQVVFKNGYPFKSAYRKYKIKIKNTPDDPAMIHEVLFRRLQRLKKVLLEHEQQSGGSSNYIPDIIMIDGGTTQLGAALRAKEDVFFDAPTRIIEKVPHIASLAKKEETIYNEDGEIINLDKNLDGMRLLRHTRDEAHRFSVAYHRTLRAHAMYQ